MRTSKVLPPTVIDFVAFATATIVQQYGGFAKAAQRQQILSATSTDRAVPLGPTGTVLVDRECGKYTRLMVAAGFLYELLADELGQAIDRGALRAGDRLPSVRRLAEERSVSVSTVLEAYLQLENAGLIEVRPK